MRVEDINPYEAKGDKSSQVEEMFDSIAPAYDFMNTAMTFGLHRRWRDKALKAAMAMVKNPQKVLDIATGTGDVSFRLASILSHSEITGIDLSEGMLNVAREKLSKMNSSVQSRVAFGKGDCLMLPFLENEFDLITVAYGVRNFSDLPLGLKEIKRVLSDNGVLCIIELSCPTGTLTAPLYKLYSGKLIPFVGRLVSGDSRAYSYLPESIAACPQRNEMAALLYEAGFKEVSWHELTFGAVTYYLAR